MPVANIQLLGLPNYYLVTMSGTRYPIAIDAALQVHNRLAGAFAPHASESGSPSAPDMTVTLDAGAIQNGISFASVASQATSTITAPVTNPRRDIVHIDARTGAVGVAAGAEAASPSDPAIPAGKIAVARVNLTVGMTVIDDLDIDDLRPTPLPFNLISYSTATPDRAADFIVFYDATDGTHKVALLADAIPSEDQTARDIAISALIAATSTGGVRGAVVSWVANADNFTVKTGATFDTDHYHNPGGSSAVSGGTGTAIGNMTGGGGLAAAFDGTTNQAAAAAAALDNSALAGTLGKDWGSGNSKVISNARVYGPNNRGISRNSGDAEAAVTMVLYGSDAGLGVSGVSLGTASSGVSVSAVVDIASGSGTAYRYHWVEVPATDASSDKVIAELQFTETTAEPEMTLSDDAETIGADCELVDVYVLEKAIDAVPTRRIRASIDGGTTWANGVLQAPDYAVGDKQLYRYQCDVSVQNVGSPSPRSLKVEYNTLNDGKERNLYRLDAVPLYA